MLDNGSAVSLASSTESGSGRMKDRGWRKPVPKFIPDPPRRFSPLSESMVFRQFAGVKVPYTEQDHPPLPENWRENIEKALHHEERHVERPFSPTPDNASDHSARSGNYVMRDSHPFEKDPDVQARKAAPTPPCSQDDHPHSDAGSTLTESTLATKLDSCAYGLPGTAANPRGSSRKHFTPPINRPPSPPPPTFLHKNRRPDIVHVPQQSAEDPPFRIVYPDPSNSSSLDNLNRNAAVFPAFPGSSADMSVDVTAVDSREDVRSTVNPSPHPGMHMPALHNWESKGSMSSFPRQTGAPSVPSRSVGCPHLTSCWYVVVHTVRSTFCMQPRTVPY